MSRSAAARRLIRRWSFPALGLAACVFVLAAAVGASAAAPNGYTEVTKTYSTAGCTIWDFPAALAGSVSVTAVGAAGATAATNGEGGSGGSGGAGDEIVGTITGLELITQSLDICVDYGGGAGGTGTNSTDDGGAGGGASGVAYGTNFSEPFVVAAGGGGGGAGPGASAGGAAGQNGSGVPEEAGSGGGASDSGDGTAGSGYEGNGEAGSEFNASGPGDGGNGQNGETTFGAGGGGGGYYGGGGGGAGMSAGAGGGGGSDFCSPSYGDYGISVTLSSCSVTAGAGTGTSAGTSAGDAEVILQYEVFTGFSTSISTGVYDASTSQPWSQSGEPGSDGAYDTATLTGAPYTTIGGYTFAVDGTVTYDLYDDDDCSGNTPASTQTVDVGSNGTVPNSSSTGTLSPGNYSFQATYNGGSDYAASAPGTCEPFTVNASTVGTSLTAFPQLDFLNPALSVGEYWVGARLTAGGQGVSGQTISFSLGRLALCSAVTNSSGFARCRINPVAEALVLLGGYQASFAGNTSYLSSSAATPAIVLFLLRWR